MALRGDLPSLQTSVPSPATDMFVDSINDHIPAWTTEAQGGLWDKGRKWLGGLPMGLTVEETQGRGRRTWLCTG